MTTPRRRWFRFSLRTMFVVLTLAAAPMAWFGWQWRIVQERQRLRQEIELTGGKFEPLTRFAFEMRPPSFETIPASVVASRNSSAESRYRKRSYLPFPRKWLGDEPIKFINLPFPYSEPHVGPIRAIFPEAQLEPFRPENH